MNFCPDSENKHSGSRPVWRCYAHLLLWIIPSFTWLGFNQICHILTKYVALGRWLKKKVRLCTADQIKNRIKLKNFYQRTTCLDVKIRYERMLAYEYILHNISFKKPLLFVHPERPAPSAWWWMWILLHCSPFDSFTSLFEVSIHLLPSSFQNVIF